MKSGQEKWRKMSFVKIKGSCSQSGFNNIVNSKEVVGKDIASPYL